jgi:hypothetical protein
MYLKGIPVPTIMSISSHKTEKNFYKYIKADGMEHAKMMKRMLTNPTTEPTETVHLFVHPTKNPRKSLIYKGLFLNLWCGPNSNLPT